MRKLPTALPFGTSLARQVARQNLTRFNNIFWVSERARKYLRAGFPSIRFPPAGPGVHGVFNTEEEWLFAADEFRDWTRQHVLISAASLLEVYLYSITKTALQAKPELIDRSLTGIDGYRFVFEKDTPPAGWKKSIDSCVDGFVTGLWKDRIRRLEIVFGNLPVNLTKLESDLQKIQNKRNRIAHQFGLEARRNAPWDAASHVPVGAKDCEKAIKTVSTFIADADTNVFANLVGAHEILSLYHDWSRKEPNLYRYKVLGTCAAKFCDHLGGFAGNSIGKNYANAIISHYDSL